MTPYRRKLEQVSGQLKPAPEPDVSGWTADQVLLWAAENDQYEELVRRINEQRTIRMTTPEENEAALRAAGRWEEPEPVAETPAPQPEAPPPAPELTPQQAYWEEKVRWRFRTAEDYADWENGEGNQVEHEYDPFKENDYDPFGRRR